MPENEFSTDHDALITLIAEVRQVRYDIKDLKDGITAQIDDHEIRIRAQEAFRWKLIGINSAVSFTITVLGVLAAFLVLGH